MTKPFKIFISVLTCLLANGLFSQEWNKIYYGIVSDSIHRDHYLEFKNDSIVELTTIRRFVQPQLRIELKYSKQNETILIHSETKEENNNELNQYGFSAFTNGIILKIDENALLDKKNKVIYIFLDDFKKTNYTTYIIDGEEFKQENLKTNSYGLVETEMQMDRKLKKKLKRIKSDLENEKYNIVVYRGIDAYLKFGYDNVMGVIELKRK